MFSNRRGRAASTAWAFVAMVALIGGPALAQPAEPIGGIGVSFAIEPDRITVAQVLPGSPGDSAEIPVGAILLEVDGKPVAGLSRDQLADLIRGRVGSRIRLTFDADGRERIVRLRRADLSQLVPAGDPPPPAPQPERPGTARDRTGNDAADDPPAPRGLQARPDRPNPALAAIASTMGDVELILGITPQEAARFPAPAFAHPGVRLMYESTASASTNAFQRQGISLPEWDTPTGHVSLAAIDIVGIEAGAAIAVRTDFLIDPNTRSITGATAAHTSAGPASAMQDYWIHPDILATAEARIAGRDARVFRGTYQLNGRTHQVVRIRIQSRESVTHWMFDAESGLLLVLRGANLAGRYNTSRNNNPAHDDWQETSQVQLRYLGTRQIDWPGLDGRMPEWARPGRTMTYRGHDYIVVGGQATSAGERATRYHIAHAGRTMLLGTLRALTGHATDDARAMGGGVAGYLGSFILPEGAWDQMRRGQVIDRDPVTGVEIVVADKTADTVTIEQRHPSFRHRRVFDRQGRLVQAEEYRSTPTGGQGWLFNLVAVD